MVPSTLKCLWGNYTAQSFSVRVRFKPDALTLEHTQLRLSLASLWGRKEDVIGATLQTSRGRCRRKSLELGRLRPQLCPGLLSASPAPQLLGNFQIILL